MIGYGIDRGGPKDSENAPNSFLTKFNQKGFWRFATDIYKLMKLKWLLITTCAYHIQRFHTLVQTIFITHWLSLLSTVREIQCVSVQILPLREKGFFGVLWGPCRSNPQFDLTRFLSYVPVMTYPKIILLGLVVSEEIGVKVFRYFFALSFIR